MYLSMRFLVVHWILTGFEYPMNVLCLSISDKAQQKCKWKYIWIVYHISPLLFKGKITPPTKKKKFKKFKRIKIKTFPLLTFTRISRFFYIDKMQTENDYLIDLKNFFFYKYFSTSLEINILKCQCTLVSI